MHEKKTFANYYSQENCWGKQIKHPNGNICQFGIAKNRVQKLPGETDNFNGFVCKTIKSLQDPDYTFEKRLPMLKKIKNEDSIVSIEKYAQKQNTQQIMIISKHFTSSINLNQYLNKKEQGYRYTIKIAEIFHQIARALRSASEKYQVAHLRLVPSCILIKTPPNNFKKGNMMVRISDFGLGLEKKQFQKYPYFHPKFINSTINPYQLSASQAFKYDLWSYGVLLSEIIFQTNIFNQNTASSMTVQNCQQKIKNKFQSDNIRQQDVFMKCIFKCLQIENPFKNWREVINYFEKIFEFSSTIDTPAASLFLKHTRIMHVFSEIYIMSRKRILQKYEQPQSNPWVTEKRLQHLSELLIIFAQQLHEIEFNIFFQSRCYILGFKALEILRKLSQYFMNEMNYLKEESKALQIVKKKSQKKLETIFEKRILGMIIFCKMIEKNQRSKDKVLDTVCVFWEQFHRCCSQGKESLKKEGRQKFLMCIYDSEIFQKMAQEFGFENNSTIC